MFYIILIIGILYLAEIIVVSILNHRDKKIIEASKYPK